MIITVQRNERHASQKNAEKIELLVTNRHCQEMNFASMLKDAAPEQVKLCLSVCKTIIEHGESHQFK